MEKAIKNKVTKAVVPANDVMFQALRYNGVEGLHSKVTEFVKDKDCLVCGPGILVELDTSVALRKLDDIVTVDVVIVCFLIDTCNPLDQVEVSVLFS
ncbi:NEDD8-activating enzyme E1 catalytic subunit [Camellia lanceoleosa]|uniref:NEDD8-activating enzyme E1 catalytic subunit n=1 Tax=Camellia lanceoleosa TaxID=1840588 RepID=A0ACC0HY90_9ERIC|nr:NEDD8-activating enzyme E1 catalytic subunit [Camellia lanceoleosa]